MSSSNGPKRESQRPANAPVDIDTLCGEFEQAWLAGERPDVATYVASLLDEDQAEAASVLGALQTSFQSQRDKPTNYAKDVDTLPPAAANDTDHKEAPLATILVEQGKHSQGLTVRCPDCQTQVTLEANATLTGILCCSCGGSFSLIEESGDESASKVRQVGQFQLVEQVGMGAFGSVWKAIDAQLDRVVAIKVPRRGQLEPTELEQFFREARSAAQLRHPNIVAVHEVGRADDSVYIVSEFIEGSTLAERLEGGGFSVREAVELVVKIADGLQHAHQAGVIHRDLKPQNIMMDQSGEPHIVDFGLAKRDVGEVTMTHDGAILGTPSYMSPEQAAGKANQVDRTTDVYSLGVILFQLLTRELPFRGNVRMVIHKVISDDPPSLRKLDSNIPRDIETIALKCLSKSPKSRFPTALALADDLGRFLRGEPIVSRPISAAERGWRWCRRNPTVASLVATAAVLLVTVAAVATVGYITTSAALAEEERSSRTSDEVSRFLEDLFIASTPIHSDDQGGLFGTVREQEEVDISVRELLERAAKSIDESLSDQPQVRARLLTSIGSAYHGLGSYDVAAEMFRESYDLEQAADPIDPIAIGDALHRLAFSLAYGGQYQKAESIARQSLEVYEGAGADGVLPACSVKQSLGLLYSAMNRPEDAERLLKELISTREQISGPDDIGVVRALEALTAVYLTNGQGEKAEDTTVRILQITSLKKNGDWNKAADIVGQFQRGLYAQSVGDYEQSEVVIKRVRDEVIELLGNAHPFVSLMQFEYAGALKGLGRDEQAYALMEKSIDDSRRKTGPNHPLLLYGQLQVMSIYLEDHRFKDAHRIHQSMTKPVVQVWGVDSPQYASHLAFEIAIANELESAANPGPDVGAQAIEIAERALRQGIPISDSTRSMAMRLLSLRYSSSGDKEKALRALAIAQAWLPKSNTEAEGELRALETRLRDDLAN